MTSQQTETQALKARAAHLSDSIRALNVEIFQEMKELEERGDLVHSINKLQKELQFELTELAECNKMMTRINEKNNK